MTTVGFIGTGNMGGAIIRGFASRDDVKLVGYNRSKAKLETLKAEAGLVPMDSAAEVAAASDYIVVGVKPFQFQEILAEIEAYIDSGKCVISIAAGLKQEQLKAWVKGKCAVVRIMPNTPAMVGAGVFAICTEDQDLGDDRASFISELFSGIGQVHVLPEKQFDAFTAVAGSGPAYVFHFMEAVIEAGVTLGLTRDQATQMVEALFTGSAKLAAESDLHVSQLREMVCSPGGTTIAALNVFDENAVRSAILKGVMRSAERSKELGG